VAIREFAGVPCVLFLGVLGRLAIGNPRHLIQFPRNERNRSFASDRRNRSRGQRVSFIRNGDLPIELKEDAMTDPRFTDPRYSDPQLSDPVIRRDESVGGMWGWIAGVAVLLLIGFLIVAGWNNNSNTARSGSSPTATSRTATPPSTTGSGSASPKPFTPAPSTPAPSTPPPPANSDKQ